jgi:hypothetical protein
MTGTNCDLFKHKQSRSYLNHPVLTIREVLRTCIFYLYFRNHSLYYLLVFHNYNCNNYRH